MNFSKAISFELIEEAAKRFGKEKISVSLNDFDALFKQQHLIEECSSEILFMHRLDLDSVMNVTDIPCVVLTDTNEKSELFKILKCPGVKGLSGAYKTGEVLMFSYMDKEAFYNTIKTGKMTYYDREAKRSKVQGEESGHYQYVKALTINCDKEALLAKVEQIGPACKTGNATCFFQPLVGTDYDGTNPLQVFETVYEKILECKKNPRDGSYTNYLFDKGIDKILKKVGEEATELIIAAKNPNPGEIKGEISDFLYHAMVLMVERGVKWEDIIKELAER